MKNNPKYIIIHCTDYSYRKMADQFLACNSWHKDRDFTLSSLGYYIGYQRIVTGDKNYQARLDTDVGCHCNQGIDANLNPIQNPTPGTSMNYQSLGICIGFDGDIEMPTPIQYGLVQKQVWDWQDQYGIPNSHVFFHRHFATEKSCPGGLLSADWLAKLLVRPIEAPSPISPKPVNTMCVAQEATIQAQAKTLKWYEALIQALRDFISSKKLGNNNMTSYRNRRFGAFGSSENPEELGTTVKGVIIGLSVVIIYLVQKFFHITWTADDVTQLATSLSLIVTQLVVAYGLVKKLVIWAIDKFHGKAV